MDGIEWGKHLMHIEIGLDGARCSLGDVEKFLKKIQFQGRIVFRGNAYSDELRLYPIRHVLQDVDNERCSRNRAAVEKAE